MDAQSSEVKISFGPVGVAGWALLVLGILVRSRLLSFAGLGAVVADVTVAELGGFRAANEARRSGEAAG
jgi:hypothetical protein